MKAYKAGYNGLKEVLTDVGGGLFDCQASMYAQWLAVMHQGVKGYDNSIHSKQLQMWEVF